MHQPVEASGFRPFAVSGCPFAIYSALSAVADKDKRISGMLQLAPQNSMSNHIARRFVIERIFPDNVAPMMLQKLPATT